MPPFPWWSQMLRYKLKWHFNGKVRQMTFFGILRYRIFHVHVFSLITATSNGHHFNSPVSWLSSCLFRLTSKETSKFCITDSLKRESTGHRWIPLTKCPVMRRVFPFHDVIMYFEHLSSFAQNSQFVMVCCALVRTDSAHSWLLNWLDH